ncbi:MAG: hypothetical protein HQ546_00880 [Planctomycetes bacterium]|nr:hypothetical protein [Planctomycetota bacterium]
MKICFYRSAIVVVLAGVLVTASAVADEGAFPDAWKSLDVAGLTQLSKEVRVRRDFENCKLLAEYVARRYTDASAAGKVDWPDWLELMRYSGDWFPESTRKAMKKAILEAIVPDEAAVIGLTGSMASKVGAALGSMGYRQDAGLICSKWVMASTKYQSTSASDVERLSCILFPATFEWGPARKRLAEHVTNKCLVDTTSIRSTPLRACPRKMGADLRWNRLRVEYGQ